MRLGERYGKIEYRGGRVIQRWRGSSGNVRPSHLIEFLVTGHTSIFTAPRYCKVRQAYNISLTQTTRTSTFVCSSRRITMLCVELDA